MVGGPGDGSTDDSFLIIGDNRLYYQQVGGNDYEEAIGNPNVEAAEDLPPETEVDTESFQVRISDEIHEFTSPEEMEAFIAASNI